MPMALQILPIMSLAQDSRTHMSDLSLLFLAGHLATLPVSSPHRLPGQDMLLCLTTHTSSRVIFASWDAPFPTAAFSAQTHNSWSRRDVTSSLKLPPIFHTEIIYPHMAFSTLQWIKAIIFGCKNKILKTTIIIHLYYKSTTNREKWKPSMPSTPFWLYSNSWS